jgi:hypothetical protein
MMRLEKALALPALGGTPAHAVDFEGTWTNQLGSTMDLKVIGQVVSGKYTSKVSGNNGGGQVKGDLAGFAAEDLISVVVKWDIPSASMTTWVGQVIQEDGEEVLRTLWHLIRDIPDAEEKDEAWAAVLTGTDVFRKAP